jgi:ornithine decarboxylase
MAAIDILPPPAYSVDLNIACSPTLGDAFPSSYQEKLANALVNGFISTSPPVSRMLPPSRHVGTDDTPDDKQLFPDLPALHAGRVSVHLRNGIINASHLSAAQEPDAEKAFFVCDLSQVYMQHLRWKKNLPEIEPFYGEYSLLARELPNEG